MESRKVFFLFLVLHLIIVITKISMVISILLAQTSTSVRAPLVKMAAVVLITTRSTNVFVMKGLEETTVKKVRNLCATTTVSFSTQKIFNLSQYCAHLFSWLSISPQDLALFSVRTDMPNVAKMDSRLVLLIFIGFIFLSATELGSTPATAVSSCKALYESGLTESSKYFNGDQF